MWQQKVVAIRTVVGRSLRKALTRAVAGFYSYLWITSMPMAWNRNLVRLVTYTWQHLFIIFL